MSRKQGQTESESLSLFIYYERACVRVHHSGRGRERQRQTQRQRESQAVCAVSMEPNMGLQLMNGEIMTQVETKSLTLNCLSYPGAPNFS